MMMMMMMMMYSAYVLSPHLFETADDVRHTSSPHLFETADDVGHTGPERSQTVVGLQAAHGEGVGVDHPGLVVSPVHHEDPQGVHPEAQGQVG